MAGPLDDGAKEVDSDAVRISRGGGCSGSTVVEHYAGGATTGQAPSGNMLQSALQSLPVDSGVLQWLNLGGGITMLAEAVGKSRHQERVAALADKIRGDQLMGRRAPS